MRRHSPPRRGYGGRGRSPPRRGYGSGRRGRGGGYGRRKDQNQGSLLVRNIPLDCRPEELRAPFERFGVVRDVYIPKDYYTGEPRGFAFVQFLDSYDAMEAQHRMNGQIFAGREMSVVVAAETRKRPEEMLLRSRVREPSGYGGRPSHYGRPRSRSYSRSRSPRHHMGSRSRYRSRSFSPAPRRRDDYASPDRRHAYPPRSLGGLSPELDGAHMRRSSYSPGYGPDGGPPGNGTVYSEKPSYEPEEVRAWKPSHGRSSRSPSRSRSRSDLSPRHSR